MTATKNKIDGSHDSCDRFRELSSRMAGLVAQEGIQITPYFDPRLRFFSALNDRKAQHVLWLLESMNELIQQTRDRGDSIRSPAQLTWAFMKRMGCTIPSDFLDGVKEIDFVDCYASDHQMIFANFRFFELMSYSLEDFYCRPWMDLFVRDRQEVHDELWKQSQRVLSRGHEGTLDMSYLGTYSCWEADSRGMNQFVAAPKAFAPLVKNGTKVGYICVNSIMCTKFGAAT